MAFLLVVADQRGCVWVSDYRARDGYTGEAVIFFS
jgi:hypothetical protein